MWYFHIAGAILLVWAFCLVINGLKHSEPLYAMIGLGMAIIAGVCFR